MYRTEKETSKGLKVLLVISFVFLAIFILGFILFGVNANKTGDADLKDFGKVFSYHFGNFKDLFTFNLNAASNVLYVALSGLLYGLVALVAIFLIVGICIAAKKKRAIMVFGIVLSVLTLLVYLLGAAGFPKYWAILNKREVFETHQELMAPTFIIIIGGTLFALFSYLTYFACVTEAFRNPGVEDKNAPRKGEQPVMFEAIKNEKPQEEKPAEKVEEKPAPEEVHSFEEEPEPEEEIEEEDSLSKKDLAELIRSIVRDEMNRNANNNNQYPNSPLIVQYFGTVPNQQVAQEVKKEEPAPTQVKEPEPEPQPEPQPEPVEEPVSEPVPQEEAIVEPAPAVETPAEETPEEEAPAEEAPVEKNKIIRIPFQVRMINADEEMKKNYNELKNEILSYGVNSRVSNSGDAFRLHRKTYVKLTIAGLSLKLYFALNPEDYKDSPIPVQDAGHKGIYAEIPLVFKVKSGLSMRRCKELIQTVMEKDGLEQGPIGDIDWVERIKDQPVDENPEED